MQSNNTYSENVKKAKELKKMLEENNLEDQFSHLPERIREKEMEKTLLFIEEFYEEENLGITNNIEAHFGGEPQDLPDMPPAGYIQIIYDINQVPARRENNIEPIRPRAARMRTSDQVMMKKKRERDGNKYSKFMTKYVEDDMMPNGRTDLLMEVVDITGELEKGKFFSKIR